VQVFAAVGFVGYVSFESGQEAVNDVASQLRQEVTARIQERLQNYMAIPPLVNQITANAIASGQLDSQDSQAFGRHFWKQILTFDIISFHYFSDTKGEFRSARRLPNGEVQIGARNQSTNGDIYYYIPNRDGDRTKLVDVRPKFDPRMRPWYKAAVAAGKPCWTGIYRHFVTKGLAITAVHPIYDSTGNLQGVLGVDFLFSQVNKFLNGIQIGQTGKTFIMDRSGNLVSTSTLDPIFTIVGEQTKRIQASNSSNRQIELTAKYLKSHFTDLSQIDRSQQLDFDIDGAKQFIQVTPLRDRLGIDWLIIVVVPESDFMAQIDANTYTTILLCFLALAVAIVVGLVTSRWIVRPILKLNTAAKNITQGKWDEIVELDRSDELGELAKSFNSMANQLQELFSKLKYSACHDALTDLPNREAFIDHLTQAIAQAKQNNLSLFAVLFLDLDSFKLVNDSLGHLNGDQLLIAASQRIKSCLCDRDIMARFGGDEFTILLLEIPNINAATQTAELISEAMERPFDLDGHEVFISTSIGIVLSTTKREQPEEFLRDADIAMYRAKSEGKSRYQIFDTLMHTKVLERLFLENDLRRGLDRHEFEIYYQPIIEAQTRQIAGFEALVRWRHPTEGLIMPAKFIPVAEETGLIISLDNWVLLNACHQMQTWQTQFPLCRAMKISVNLSAKQFLQPDLLDRIEEILQQTGLKPQNLQLEITESSIMTGAEVISTKLQRLRDLGVELSIDDFGTGYSSLSYLYRFPLQTLKVDRSFVSYLCNSHEHYKIVEAIIKLAHSLDMKVVAEGVETEEHLDLLVKIGCEYMQGYLFSPPLPDAAISSLLAELIS
jgi:diguanylate cyclase (GGDEF)-like protein